MSDPATPPSHDPPAGRPPAGRPPADHPPAAYPPARHLLRDLPFEVEIVSPTHQRAHLDPRSWTLGELAVVVDVVGGSLCAGVVAPDWMATSSLELRLGGLTRGEALTLEARVLRAGRRSVTIEATLHHADSRQDGAAAVLAFARLPRRDDNLDLSGREVAPGTRHRFGPVAGADPVHTAARVGTRVLDPATGATETELDPYVRNSFGALNGGVVAWLAARSATERCGTGWAVDELAVHHLGQGRVGPVRTSARECWSNLGRRVVRVELHDLGTPAEQPEGRLMAVAHVGLGSGRPRV